MIPLGISTCFFSGKDLTGIEMLEKTASMGIGVLELEYRLSKDQFREILRNRNKFDISIISLHNNCYRPDEIPEDEVDADYFRLSSPDDEERNKAVYYTKKTIENASEADAEYVVLHLGDTGQPKLKKDFKALADSSEMIADGQRFIQDYLSKRNEIISGSLDGVKKSLEELLLYAERFSITLAVENRYYIYQIPDFQETGFLLSEFSGAPICFWLDIGHAYVKSLWGFPGIEDYFLAYREHIVGSHIHDVIGSRDHQPPGYGSINYQAYLDLFTSDIINILEINSRYNDIDMMNGIKYIKDYL